MELSLTIDIPTLIATCTFCLMIEERVRMRKREKQLLDRIITSLLFKIENAQKDIRFRGLINAEDLFDTITKCELGVGLIERIFSLSVYKYEQGAYMKAYENYQKTRNDENYLTLLRAAYMYAQAIQKCLRFE